MALTQSVEMAHEERIGAHGVARDVFDAALARADDALDWLRGRYADGTLPLLRLPEQRDDLAAIEASARRIADGASDVVVLGTGGSSLGGQTLAQLADYGVPGLSALREELRLHFIDNLDPATFSALLGRLPLARTRFVAVSKSGGTGETLMQTAAVLSALRNAGLEARIGELVFGLSEPVAAGKRNGLRALLGAHGVSFLDHHTGVGGRYSALTNVGLLPAAVAGLDIGAIRAGAAGALAPVLASRSAGDVPAAIGAALAVALAGTRGKSVSVMMAYADRLERFTRWYVQLWAESLGKNGKGTTPLAALGPVDQHSQLQLFMDGPRDKFFTIVSVDSQGLGPRIEREFAERGGEPDFSGKTFGDLIAAQSRATAETLAKNGHPVRTIRLERLDELHLGELLMQMMLETIIAARLFGVDPFDQPAVEEGKVLAKTYLAQS